MSSTCFLARLAASRKLLSSMSRSWCLFVSWEGLGPTMLGKQIINIVCSPNITECRHSGCHQSVGWKRAQDLLGQDEKHLRGAGNWYADRMSIDNNYTRDSMSFVSNTLHPPMHQASGTSTNYFFWPDLARTCSGSQLKIMAQKPRKKA